MIDLVKAEKISKAKDAAGRLGFRNTKLMIEGLAEQLRDFEFRTVQSVPIKAKRIMSKVACIESTMQNELRNVDEKEVGKQAYSSIFSNIFASIFFNALPAVFFFHLPTIAQYPNQKEAAVFRIVVIAVFSFRIFREIKNIFKSINDYTYEGMKKNILDLCDFTQKHVEKAIDDIRDMLESSPPV